LVSSLGPQTLVVLELLHRQGRSVPVRLLDTGLLFPETLALKAAVEARYGIEIGAVLPARSVAEQAADHGEALWRRDPERCCRLRKVAPLAEALRGHDAWITGLRRDQSATRAAVGPAGWDPQHGLVKVNPLWRWSQAQALDFLREAGVPYNPLLDRGYRSVGCWPCTAPTAGGERDGRWPGHARTECGIHGGAPAAARLPSLLTPPVSTPGAAVRRALPEDPS
jgi:phosphoadenosine phosphosulfate reductase